MPCNMAIGGKFNKLNTFLAQIHSNTESLRVIGTKYNLEHAVCHMNPILR